MPETWYLRSYKDADAHHCDEVNADGTVIARCGLTFTPLPQLFGEGPAVVRPPVDQLQTCPKCLAADVKTEDADVVAVGGLVDTLSSPRSQHPTHNRFRFWHKR